MTGRSSGLSAQAPDLDVSLDRQRHPGFLTPHRPAALWAGGYGPDDISRFQMMVPTRLLPGARTARASALIG